VTVRFRYTAADLLGTSTAAMFVGTQRADGTWRVLRPVVDTVARTLSVTTRSFSDWVPMAGYQIVPKDSSVTIGQSTNLRIRYCELKPDDGELSPIEGEFGAYACQTGRPAIVSNWSVNGRPGGSSAVGTIGGSASGGTYTAPGVVPSPNPVTASVEVDELDAATGRTILAANITVVDFDGYRGLVQVRSRLQSSGETTTIAATAILAWDKTYEDATIANFDLRPRDSFVQVLSWRYENSSRVCTPTSSGAAEVSPTVPLDSQLSYFKGETRYSWTATVALRVRANCELKTTGALVEETFEGLSMILGTDGAGVVNP
jgi:hypothetical protein